MKKARGLALHLPLPYCSFPKRVGVCLNLEAYLSKHGEGNPDVLATDGWINSVRTPEDRQQISGEKEWVMVTEEITIITTTTTIMVRLRQAFQCVIR